ncbi:MAG: hypothetical protein JWM05_1461 [Acidimicrobiales bacterium]|nr:hypothetical protein [Acidimicrobiales bacterium]
MPVLDEDHDRQHPVESDGAWSESYYFNCYDPTVDCGFFSRIGVRPNEGTIDAHFALWMPDGDVAHVRFEREQHTMIDTHLEVDGVSYDCITPMSEWRIRVVGHAFVQHLGGNEGPDRVELAVDVRFHALTPAIGVDGQGGAQAKAAQAASASTGKGHLEQAGRWSGTVTIGGETLELVDGRGNRDKSWGPRSWGGPTMWRWFSINIGDDIHFGGIRIGTEAGDLHRGWVWRDGEATSVAEWKLRTELAADQLTQKVVHLTVIDKSGRGHELRGDVLRVAPLPRKGSTGVTIVNEGLTRWTYEGQVGSGIAEYLHQLDDDGRPRVPIE